MAVSDLKWMYQSFGFMIRARELGTGKLIFTYSTLEGLDSVAEQMYRWLILAAKDQINTCFAGFVELHCCNFLFVEQMPSIKALVWLYIAVNSIIKVL